MENQYVPTSPASTDRTPGIVIYLDVASKPLSAKGEIGSRSKVFRSATIQKATYHKGGLRTLKTIHCDSESDVWETIERYQRLSSPLWVVCKEAAATMELCRLWDRLESGEYSVTGEERLSQAAPMKGKRKFRGVLAASEGVWFAILRGRNGTVKIVDASNYTDASLDEMAVQTAYTLTHLPEDRAPIKQWQEYTERRVNALQRMFTNLFSEWHKCNLGAWQTTIASMSMSSYRRMGNDGLPIVDRAGDTKDLERNSYYGGRILVGKVGEVAGPIYKMDSRSFYGFIMGKYEYPVKHVRHYDWLHPAQLANYLEKWAGTALVRVKSDTDEYPVRTLSGTLYAVGHYWTTICGPELKRASDAGHIQQCLECCFYETATIFKEWSSKLWDLRISLESLGKKAEASLIKRLIVSLYGKWAQMSPTWELCPSMSAPEPWHEWYDLNIDSGECTECKSVGWTPYVRIGVRHKARTFPAISAFIASYGREYMRWVMSLLPKESMYYSAVDSIITNAAGFDSMFRAGIVGEGHIGGFKLEEFADRLIVYGPQHYRIGNRVVLAGVEKDATWIGDDRYAIDRTLSHDMHKPGRPDGIVITERLELPLPNRPVLETVTSSGLTQPPVVVSVTLTPPDVDVLGYRRVPVSLGQAAALRLPT